MLADHLVGDLQKTPVGTLDALDPRLIANPTDPFVGASRLVPGSAGFSALESAGIHILAPTE
jgi:hypothetical protein